MGEQLLDGKLLYKDAWDHKPPLVFVFNALGLLLRRDSLWGVWALQYLAIGSSAVLGYLLMSKSFGRGPAVFGTAIWLLGLNSVLDGGNLTEVYGLPFQFGSLWFFWKSLNNRSGWTDNFWVGLSSALAFWLRANIIGIQIAIGVILLWQFIVEKNKASLKKIGFMLFAWVLVSSAILAWFALQQNLPGLIDASFSFNFMYSGSTWAQKWSSFLVSLRIIPFAATFAITGWGLALSNQLYSHSLGKTQRLLTFVSMLIVLLPVELVLANVSGRAFPHYFMSLLPVYGLLSGYFLFYLYLTAEAGTAKTPTRPFRLALLGGLLVTIAALPIYSLWPAWWSSAKIVFSTGAPPSPQFGQHTSRVLNYLDQNVGREEYLVLWGKNLSFNWFTGRQVPSAHIFQDHFFVEGYSTPQMIKEYISDLEVNRPVIIDTTRDNNFIPSIDIPLDKLPQNIVHPLYIFLAEHYELVDVIPGTEFAVFRYKD